MDCLFYTTDERNEQFQGFLEVTHRSLASLCPNRRGLGSRAELLEALASSVSEKLVLIVDGWELISEIELPAGVFLVVFEKNRSFALSGNCLELSSSNKAEKKLRVFSRLSMLVLESSEDRAYFWGWLMQAGHNPVDNKLVQQLSSWESNGVAALEGLIGEWGSDASLSGIASTRKAAFGRPHIRASVPSNSLCGEIFKKLPLSGLDYQFVFPADHLNKIGLRLRSAQNLELSLFDSSNSLIDKKKFSGQVDLELGPEFKKGQMVWLSTTGSAIGSKRPAGGSRGRLLIKPLGNKSLKSSPVEVASKAEEGYPSILGAEPKEFCPCLYTIADEFGYFERSKVLLRRAARMVSEGEWSRFTNALLRRVKGGVSWIERRANS